MPRVEGEGTRSRFAAAGLFCKKFLYLTIDCFLRCFSSSRGMGSRAVSLVPVCSMEAIVAKRYRPVIRHRQVDRMEG